jgi:nucleoid-associated protein YejK
MVISTKRNQTKELEKYLEEEYQNKNLVYGIHKSDSALMTCLIFQRHGKHIHFIDSSNGGYALAAKELKNRLKNLQ